jgi:hypothetical protein
MNPSRSATRAEMTSRSNTIHPPSSILPSRSLWCSTTSPSLRSPVLRAHDKAQKSYSLEERKWIHKTITEIHGLHDLAKRRLTNPTAQKPNRPIQSSPSTKNPRNQRNGPPYIIPPRHHHPNPLPHIPLLVHPT